MKLYPTANNQHDPYGLPAYEVRGQQLYPTANNQRHPYGLPAYEMRPN